MYNSLFYLLILFLVSCGKREIQPNLPSDLVFTPTQKKATKPPGKGSRVVTDISGSMRGFVWMGDDVGKRGKKKSLALEAIHRTIDDMLSRHLLNYPEERCLLGGDLICGKQVKYADFCDQRLYTERSSRLDLALIRPKKGANENPMSPPPSDNLDPFNTTIIITDGMQAIQNRAGSIIPETNAAFEVACSAGPDPGCIASLLRERIKEDYGLWIVGIRIPFSGQHFAERLLEDQHWRKVIDHIETLRKMPEWYGQVFKVSNLRTDNTDRTSFYDYVGVKPLLLLVLSRDYERARGYVNDLVTSLRREGIGRPENMGVEWMEIAPLGYSETNFVGVKRVEGPMSDKVIIGQPKVVGSDMVVPVYCEGDGMAYIDIAIEKRTFGPPLPPFITEKIKIVHGSKVLDDKVVKKPTLLDNNIIRTGVRCALLPTGTSIASFNLIIERSVSQSIIDDTWWIKWSSDNTYEKPEALYGLRYMVESLLRDSHTWERVAGVLYLNILHE